MFQNARLKLTAWYLLIIMLISLAFSVFIYRVLTFEFNRILRIDELRREGQLLSPKTGFVNPFRDDLPRRGMMMALPNFSVVQEAKNRMLTILGMVNLSIFVMAGFAGYFLAGRTLKPIKNMVDEQNRFITDASHELRTPLTSLRSEIEVNLRDKKLTLRNAKEVLRSNLEEVNSMQHLSDNLIKLAQYQKTDSIIIEKVNLSEIAKEAIKKVSILATSKRITVTNYIKFINIEADKQKLIELLMILLDNAIKYSPKNTTVILSSQTEKNWAILIVKDQGIGIKQEDISYLFDRFYRADISRMKTDMPGYGLGLSIAKQIVDKHAGLIKVKSEFGKGTTFFVYLPQKLS